MLYTEKRDKGIKTLSTSIENIEVTLSHIHTLTDAGFAVF